MFAKTFAIATLALATLANASPVQKRVTVDPAKWYTLSVNGNLYLDSTNDVLMPQNHNSFDDLNSGTDKGVRFRFPDGLPGKLVCEAHNDHFVGLAEGSQPELNQFNTFQKEDRAVTAEAGVTGIIIHFNGDYVGTQQIGSPVDKGDAEDWDLREIAMTPL
ncbi:hypothetical protein BD626DRAFT_435130 [Schizophyllum amplum]|uniref:Uncharacterized protein n=1 Tax=Schizophyllum amplum TaxID=97359 RepID=A0A550C7G9_9AGAR|nr:hypothetical protein BD626DRAFT_435130 [Auriculariopsis ampla]